MNEATVQSKENNMNEMTLNYRLDNKKQVFSVAYAVYSRSTTRSSPSTKRCGQ